MLLLPAATTGVPVLAISFFAAGESICSRSELLGVPSLVRKAGLKKKNRFNTVLQFHKMIFCIVELLYT